MPEEPSKRGPDWATIAMLGVSSLALVLSIFNYFSGYGSQLAILEERIKNIGASLEEIKRTQSVADERQRKMENTLTKISVMVAPNAVKSVTED